MVLAVRDSTNTMDLVPEAVRKEWRTWLTLHAARELCRRTAACTLIIQFVHGGSGNEANTAERAFGCFSLVRGLSILLSVNVDEEALDIFIYMYVYIYIYIHI